MARKYAYRCDKSRIPAVSLWRSTGASRAAEGQTVVGSVTTESA
jgi:hypothetical protein